MLRINTLELHSSKQLFFCRHAMCFVQVFNQKSLVEETWVQNGHIPPMGLTSNEFREAAHKLVDTIIDYNDSLQNNERSPLPNVKPGFLRERIPERAPTNKESWKNVFEDIENVVLDGNMHWQSGRNFGYFCTGSSYPSLLGDMLSAATSAVGFTWASSPSCTELETAMLDWLGKAIGLPECFIHGGKGPGGGIIQVSASDAALVTLLSARSKALKEELLRDPGQNRGELTSRMVAYSSKYSHSCIERAALVAMVNMHCIDVDENISMRGDALRKAIAEDKENGKIPIYVCATLGTTSCLSYDNLPELGSVCQKENMWLHVDAAYAGVALLCPEFKYIGKGIENVTSFNFNPHKGMQVHFDCSALWVRNIADVMPTFIINPVFLQHEEQYQTIDYMDWEIPLGRRFRSIKLWFVMRMIGLEGLREYVRQGVERAKYFEALVKSDQRFEVMFPVTLGLVCFRMLLPGENTLEICKEGLRIEQVIHKINEANRELRKELQSDQKYHITPAIVKEMYFLRVSTGTNYCTKDILKQFWLSIQEKAQMLLHPDRKEE